MFKDLVTALTRYTESQSGEGPFTTPIEGFSVLRADNIERPNHYILKPALCMVLQGAKWTTYAGKRVDFMAGQALVVNVEMPLVGRVVAASPSEPFLGIVIEFDLAIMQDVIHNLGVQPSTTDDAEGPLFVTDLTDPLIDCALRTLSLLDTPTAIPLLYPGIMREICYWLLTGPNGGYVMRVAMANGHEQRVIKAIHDLRDRFNKSVRIEELAAIANMSESAFHRQFKGLTSMTPLQYQKQLRLLEARRLMVSDDASVETAAFEVGYESPSQFSREYSRMFGLAPRRDVQALRSAASY